MKHKKLGVVLCGACIALVGCSEGGSIPTGTTTVATNSHGDMILDKNDTSTPQDEQIKKHRVSDMLYKHDSNYPKDFELRSQVKNGLGVEASQAIVSYCNGYGCMVETDKNDNAVFVSVTGTEISSVQKMVVGE